MKRWETVTDGAVCGGEVDSMNGAPCLSPRQEVQKEQAVNRSQ